MPSPEVIRQLLRYEPETGKLFWLERSPEQFRRSWECAQWNRRYSDQEAFTTDSGIGYKQGKIFDHKILAHRAIWAIKTGDWPKLVIDHANGDRSDNRWQNLREASYSQNSHNRRKVNGTSSRFKGVCWHRTQNRWIASIRINSRIVHLGTFIDEESAATAYEKKAREVYGPFASLNTHST